ncbi:M23 family metallopeptidase [Roseomonas sp. USHLN139]|uniref:M23 family metallopeptidase n=1 Tax=Roseomonas sp. USHLN139 TaxID=3081298 RepID=UPI003B0155A1
MRRRLFLAAAPALLLAGCEGAEAQRSEARTAGPTVSRLLSLGDDGLTQGGMALGKVPPGSRVTLDGRAVSVAPDGQFVIGFGRDAGPSARLVAIAPDGRQESRELAIRTRDWDIQRLTGLPPAMVSPNPQQLARIKAERERIAVVRKIDSALPHFAEGFVWPARGRISGVYGSQRILNGEARAPHLGLDIAVPTGTPCHAMGAGRVVLAEDLYFTGNTILLDHGHGVVSLYAHLSVLEVANGATVGRGQRIAQTGATGRVTGPHLHLGMNWLATALDPQPLLPPQG